MKNREYEVGFIYARLFIQKEIVFHANVKAVPLLPTGLKGMLHDMRGLLGQARFDFTSHNLKDALEQYANVENCVLIEFNKIEADSFITAIEDSYSQAEDIVGSLAMLSANPGVALCAFARSKGDSGIKVYAPLEDRVIYHGTNIGGYLDAVPDLGAAAQRDAKLSLLLKLFRASLREREIDNQMLFQLILLEEVSDGERGAFAQRLRTFSKNIGIDGDLNAVAGECGITLPEDKDVVDLLVKLRNCAAHNGVINEASLREFNGEWAIPTISDKPRLHKFITECLRYMFCCLVGHTRDTMATEVCGNFTARYD